MPEELCMEVHNIVQEAVIKTIPNKKKCKKAKWLSEETLQIAEKWRDAKGEGEKDIYTHLNAEFQRIARRDKKAFLSDPKWSMQITDAGKDWGQEDKGVTENEIFRWHDQLNGQEFDWTPENSEGQGSLVCFSPWGYKGLAMT